MQYADDVCYRAVSEYVQRKKRGDDQSIREALLEREDLSSGLLCDRNNVRSGVRSDVTADC